MVARAFRISLLALTLPIPLLAQETTQCDLTDDQTNCSRILACFGTDGRWFQGRAFGRGEGTLAGTSSDGVNCTGIWMSDNGQGHGEAQVACDDGMTVTVIFDYQDAYTGTTTGQGLSNTGISVRSWSGLHVIDYLRRESGSSQAVLPCGVQDIPIS